jgi:hypothetical protein
MLSDFGNNHFVVFERKALSDVGLYYSFDLCSHLAYLLERWCDTITTALSLFIVHEALQARRAGPRHRAHARQRSARWCIARSAPGRRRFRCVMARESPKRAAVTRVARVRA